MRIFLIAALLSASLAAQDGTAVKPPTVEELQAQIKAKDARIVWLNKKVMQLEVKTDALIKYYQADEAILKLELETTKPTDQRDPNAQ